MKNHVPFLDLAALHREPEAELLAVVRNALRAGRFIGGPEVEDFEREFATFCGTDHCAGVGSGTDALRFALMAAGVKPGDMVITVPFTFIATTEAITQAGARPAFVDIDPETYTLDPRKLEEFVHQECVVDDVSGILMHRATRCPVTAVVPVHLYGQMADMDAILSIADRYGMTVIEDACQAHGAAYRSGPDGEWRTAGSAGRAAAFSFYPGKNLGACGEGGAVTTNDETIAARVRMLRDHGQVRKYVHAIEGYNGRLDAIQAGILRVKLRSLEAGNCRRRAIAANYHDLLGELKGIVLPAVHPRTKHAFHLFSVRVPKRNELQAFLEDKNIGTGLHYPVPLHLQQAYEWLGFGAGSFPVSEKVAGEVLSLPLFPGLGEDDQLRVIEGILEFGLPAYSFDAVPQAA